MKNATTLGTVVIAGLFAGASSLILAQGTATGPAVKPAAVAKKAGTAAPADAKTDEDPPASTMNRVSTANSATDADSFWVEKLDVDGDGDVEDTNLVWDDEDGILFAYTVGVFGCKNGGTATAELLIGINAAGNPRGSDRQAPGSGSPSLDKGECGAQAAAMWGCKFEVTGAEYGLRRRRD